MEVFKPFYNVIGEEPQIVEEIRLFGVSKTLEEIAKQYENMAGIQYDVDAKVLMFGFGGSSPSQKSLAQFSLEVTQQGYKTAAELVSCGKEGQGKEGKAKKCLEFIVRNESDQSGRQQLIRVIDGSACGLTTSLYVTRELDKPMEGFLVQIAEMFGPSYWDAIDSVDEDRDEGSEDLTVPPDDRGPQKSYGPGSKTVIPKPFQDIFDQLGLS